MISVTYRVIFFMFCAGNCVAIASPLSSLFHTTSPIDNRLSFSIKHDYSEKQSTSKPSNFLNNTFDKITKFLGYQTGDRVIHTKVDTFRNEHIPFKNAGSGFSTEMSTDQTNVSTTYFKENKHDEMVSKASKWSGLSSDTKFAITLPYLSQIKLFGGYSYDRNTESKLIKGPSFGFQADVMKYVKVDTTFIKQREGKTAAKVLFSISVPFDKLSF